MSITTLICPCGMRLKTPGAVPGRVGKCPRCGSLLKVPGLEPEPEPEPESPALVDPHPARPTFVDRRERRSSRKGVDSVSGGLVASPRDLETRWQESLLYPLRGDASVALLVFMPPGLWFATVPLFGLIPSMIAGTGLSLFALIFLFPFVLMLAIVGGHTLGYLGQVLVTSSIGEIHPPRPTSWALSEIQSTLFRWFCALVLGVVVGGAPTLIYWINCGEVDWLDRIVILDLIIPGLAYAQMALLATLIHESPLAANPVTVLQAIGRVGWSYWKPCVTTGSVLLLLVLVFEGLMRIKDPLGQAVAFLIFWVLVVYASILVLRWLGLFCHRQAKDLGWFPGPTMDAMD